MQDNVAVMTEVFKTAMVFEQHKYVWEEALAYVNQKLAQNQDRQEKTLGGIEKEKHTIATVDETYRNYTHTLKSAQRDRKKKVAIIVGVVLAAIALIAFLAAAGLGEIAMVLFTPLSIVIPLTPIILLVFFWRNRGRGSETRTTLTNLNSNAAEKQKEIARNNINNYNAFLEKSKQERAIMISKKNAIEQERNKAVSVLREIYSKGWIPIEYQDLVPIATIYGYLRKGVCTVIRGHGGVYERYDNDLQHEEIVGHLKDISRKMSIIIRNQVELKRTMDSIKYTLSGIKNEIESGNEILRDIRSNTGIAAATAQQSAAYQEYIATAVWRSL